MPKNKINIILMKLFGIKKTMKLLSLSEEKYE
jgi:hypothetical protein